MTDRVDVHSLRHALRVDVLSPAVAQRIREETLAVLARVGVDIGSEPIRRSLEAAGAEVDSAGERVRFPAALVEEAVGRAPREILLAGRAPGADLTLNGRQGYLSVDGCAAEIVDLESGSRRSSTLADLAQISRLADALPEIGLLWQGVAARDAPPASQSLCELQTQLASSRKHIQMMTAVTPTAARGVVEIAQAVTGGARELAERPIVSAFQCSLSPLSYDAGALEAALVYAEAGIPCGFVVMPIACATAPATPAGALVQSNAEVLAGIVTLELLAPGSPTFYGACTTVMDLRSGAAACGGPEDLLFQMAAAQLAREYGLPSAVGTFATGAKAADWQAGLENGLSALASGLAGADLLCGAGLLYGARVFSLEQMVLDCETFGLLRHLVGLPAALEPERSLPVIEEVGPGGQYLGSRHTLEHMRSQWMPKLFDRTSWEEWEVSGRRDPRDAARERVTDLLASHTPPGLEEGLQAEIERIIAHAESREERDG